MKARCLNTNAPNYTSYGGRGITICERWMSFVNFLADMGERPPGTSLDRIDNDRDYCPDNCRWATPRQQSRNTRIARLITFNGETMRVVEWAERLGLNEYIIRSRLKYGWSVERALTRPVKKR